MNNLSLNINIGYLLKIKDKVSPLPWAFNSYSCLFSVPLNIKALDLDIIEKENKKNQLPIDYTHTAYLPIAVGDTGRNQLDGCFIEAISYTIYPLIDEYQKALKTIEQLKEENTKLNQKLFFKRK